MGPPGAVNPGRKGTVTMKVDPDFIDQQVKIAQQILDDAKVKDAVRNAALRATLDKLLTVTENEDGTWTAIGTPEQFRAILNS